MIKGDDGCGSNTFINSRPLNPDNTQFGSSGVSNEDSSSPYYIHSSDHLGLVLVSNPLTNTNYNSRRKSIFKPLIAKNKAGFIDGSIEHPELDDLLQQAWNRCDSLFSSWLVNFVSREIVDSLLYLPTAHDVWDDFKAPFLQGNGPCIFKLKQQLIALHQGSLDVNTYYTQMKMFWDELLIMKSFLFAIMEAHGLGLLINNVII